jgi:anti-sigma factor ChrR (cupin superfamily)
LQRSLRPVAVELNADFQARAVMHAADMPWVPSPTPGVDRRMLDRVGGEIARATSIVRYAPGSRFPSHVHAGGEEFLVLDGVFSDETGDMPPGTYVRNPPGTSHAPSSSTGCTLFVKLWQFAASDQTPVRLDTVDQPVNVSGEQGDEAAILHCDLHEEVRIEGWSSGALIERALAGGGEFLVLDGRFESEREVFRRWSWLRLPSGSEFRAVIGADGCRVWVKTGHLVHPIVRPAESQIPIHSPR